MSKRRMLAIALAAFCLACALMVARLASAKAVEEKKNVPLRSEAGEAIESALFTRAEFFGAQAIVPYPMAEARNRLADVLKKYPDEPEIFLKLSELDEKLARYEQAQAELEKFVALKAESLDALENLAAFYERRAQFEKEAQIIEKMLAAALPESRAQVFARLTELARAHQLESYLKPEFYQKYITNDTAAFEIVEQYLDKLTEERNYTGALAALREYKGRFPERESVLLEKEVSLLDKMNRAKEAEQVYSAAFDPFWPKETASAYYEFLSNHDRFRAYGHELRDAFRRDPANFEVAVRLMHYQDYVSESQRGIVAELEKARAARNIKWKPEELATVARLLIAGGDGDTASRFLYTLYAQHELSPGSPLRAKVLYQLFELLSDAGDQRLALTRGDLKFYEDIATSDPHPGITGGILSLILSDTNLKYELERADERAVKFFNRAAAYRIFKAYKEEYPTSPELAQMYLDIVRLYSAAKEPKVAQEALNEFEARYTDAPEFPVVALKLADCYVALEDYDEERAVYQRVMDYFGKKRKAGELLIRAAIEARMDQKGAINISSEPAENKPEVASYPPQSNPGIDIPSGNAAESGYFSVNNYHDYLPASLKQAKDEKLSQESISYSLVLSRTVASLSREKRTDDILALYARELKKYPDEPALYEEMLEWLGQTNLVDEQLRVYQSAIDRFPTMLWQDRLARWFLRHERKNEFAELSRRLLEKMDDEETRAYLEQFVQPNSSAYFSDPKSFDAQLYLGLYTRARARFPHRIVFVRGLLKFYKDHHQLNEWRRLMAEYYFKSREIREEFLAHLASRQELRAFLNQARQASALQSQTDALTTSALPYKLFRADAAARLANYEEAIDAYRELNRLYPHTPEFSERLISFTRSLGQHNRKFLEEAAAIAHDEAESQPSSSEYRTRAGEIQAELGNYERARGEWEQLIATAKGEPEIYLETATVYWDYFQYDDALRIIDVLRREMNDPRLYAFQAGAIYEAKHKMPQALAEYMKALSYYAGDEEVEDSYRAQNRLVKLYKRTGLPAQISAAFERERARRGDDSALVLDYAVMLGEAKEWTKGGEILRAKVSESNDAAVFLDDARQIFARFEDKDGEQFALRRLSTVATSPRKAISYKLQLADSLIDAGKRMEAASVVKELVGKFPTNYGVLNEADSLYWRAGLRDDSVRLLEAAAARGRGRFHYLFGRKLAARLVALNRLPKAERVLTELHAEDKLNIEVFHELARIYIRTANTGALKKAFAETLAAIKDEGLELSELHAEIADLRRQMIDAFTRLKDYRAAIEQHIEIINREPDDEETVEAAISYVKRYGGADALLDYYLRTSQTAYKNYRWNVVLARIYEARQDFPKAAENYRAAIKNQPEMVELHDALATLYLRMKNYDAALASLRRAEELTNDDPQYVKRIIDVLDKAGRKREAEIEREKLPPAENKKQAVAEEFAEAARLRATERAKAIAEYRQAFDAVLSDPFTHEFKASDITGYAQTVRDEDRLDEIAARLWALRDKLIAEANRKNSMRAGQARGLLSFLDGVMPEAVGRVAAQKGTGDELTALYKDLSRRIESASAGDAHETLALLQNLSHAARFGALEEKILQARISAARSAGLTALYHDHLHKLSDFYAERGDYSRVIKLLETERAIDADRDNFSYLRLIAENARLIGDQTKELAALRENYKSLKPANAYQSDEMVKRYFEALSESGASGREELRALAQNGSTRQLAVINFLLGKGDSELAHLAIEHATMSEAWKLARHASVSLALNEHEAKSESYFRDALQLASIGELVKQRDDKAKQLTGDDWFQLARDYGEWLSQSSASDANEKARVFLPAMIENRPKDGDEHLKLGRLLLARRDYARSLAELQLALEMKPDDKQLLAALGSAYFNSGDAGKAREIWSRIISDKKPQTEDCRLYLETLSRHHLAAEARERLSSAVVKVFSEFDGSDVREIDESTYEPKRKKELESTRELLHALADSFAPLDVDAAKQRLTTQDESSRAKYLLKIAEATHEDNVLVAELSIRESLVSADQFVPFYELLVRRSTGLNNYERDADYTAQLAQTWSADEAEESLDQETAYEPSEPESKRTSWQKEYLNYLIARHEKAAARRLINEVETEIARRYACPAWLRLATLRLEIEDWRAAQALASLKHFVGIEVASSVASVKPPSIKRLNLAVNMLKDAGRKTEADALAEAAYLRTIALEHYETPAFVALSRLSFARGDGAGALKILAAMVALSDDEMKETAAAEIAAWPEVKAYAGDSAKSEDKEEASAIVHAEALRLAVETANEYAQLETAINYRQQLLAAAPQDSANRIELARLFAANKNYPLAASNLAEVIGDRLAMRSARWRALSVASEIFGKQSESWSVLKEKTRGDSEMATAIDALALIHAGRADEAVKIVEAASASNPNPELEFFRALMEKRAGKEADALRSLKRTLIADKDESMSESFGFAEESPLRQLTRLYLKEGQPLAALKLADEESLLNPQEIEKSKANDDEETETNEVEDVENPFEKKTGQVNESLEKRTREIEMSSRLEIMGLLSEAAEQTGQLERAIEFEKARLALLTDKDSRRACEARLEKLSAAQKEKTAGVRKVERVDENLLSRRS